MAWYDSMLFATLADDVIALNKHRGWTGRWAHIPASWITKHCVCQGDSAQKHTDCVIVCLLSYLLTTTQFSLLNLFYATCTLSYSPEVSNVAHLFSPCFLWAILFFYLSYLLFTHTLPKPRQMIWLLQLLLHCTVLSWCLQHILVQKSWITD